jgi:hypothetical protein
VISPLREKWLQRTGDLLADTFVDAKGIQPYRLVQHSCLLITGSSCHSSSRAAAGCGWTVQFFAAGT